MLAAARSRILTSLSPHRQPPWIPRRQNLGFPLSSASAPPMEEEEERLQFLNLEEVEKVLSDVRADDVRVIPVKDRCDWTDFMVVATGRSTWHVRNIAQALIHKARPLSSPFLFTPNIIQNPKKNDKELVIELACSKH